MDFFAVDAVLYTKSVQRDFFKTNLALNLVFLALASFSPPVESSKLFLGRFLVQQSKDSASSKDIGV